MRTLADLAAQQGIRPQTFLNRAAHKQTGHPAPISSEGSRTLLFDGEQVDAYLAGRPVPPLRSEDDDQDHDDEDLLDRREAAAALSVVPDSWRVYKRAPLLAEHVTVVGGVEHWPRRIVHRYRDERPGLAASPGRPTGSGDLVPRDQLLPRTAPLLDADPAVTATTVVDMFGVTRSTAQNALTRLRADRIADLITTRRELTPEVAAVALGYPAGQARRATVRAEAVLRARQIAPYLADMAAAVHRAGWTTTEAAPAIQHPTDDDVVAVLTLDGPAAPTVALVWDERHGWRTATSRRHPLTRGAAVPPEGDGIRYLATGITPPPRALIAALSN
ncbi:DUF6292 family protein (plasmid) [Streptomyces poriferorum]|uniref:DUF6292 family protein n=1 Tax=Streptomyces poriferorum TaxID=2798799 RepID=A0ABY9J689_9ACTN|nr:MULTISPECIES: DUF6292 family protein [unclassified Streptomyces]WLQ53919.1 DUF6292 family protein [Streptomyces sp. Alt1]WLQ61501.1 DUF6292 family protein [Streptomyces sp. Alt2]